MKKHFAYIRVSTPKQGLGVSLEEQQAAIKAHAARNDIAIVEWFEEKETAAKTGRALFSKMLARLERGEADGVIIHKIDRSARNLWDWANLSKLFDRGIDVQFAHDGVDLKSRGGRLSADIMAIVAADYVRNLKEEVKKGFYGRLKQGVYPLQAPIGYLNKGSGRLKEIDPERAPLVQFAFERYATGQVSLKQLRMEMRARGLRSRSGKPLSLNCLSLMLNNPFYIGLIRVRKAGETFEGKHTPLIRKGVFDRVQAILKGRKVATVIKHDFVFKRLVRCSHCGRSLAGERQKGHVYYRCHGEKCQGRSVREEPLDDLVQKNLKLLVCDTREMREVRDIVERKRMNVAQELEKLKDTAILLLAKCDERITRLTDALIDGLVDKDSYNFRNETLLKERLSLRERLDNLSVNDLPEEQALEKFELGNMAHLRYRTANSWERRKIIEQLSSNFTLSGKNPAITLRSPFQELANWRKLHSSGLARGRLRTRARQLLKIIMQVESHSQNTLHSENATPSMKAKADFKNTGSVELHTPP